MVDRVVERARREGVSLGQALLDAEIVSPLQLAQALAERNGLDYVDLNRFDVDKGAASLIDGAKVRRYRTIPIAFLADRTLRMPAAVEPVLRRVVASGVVRGADLGDEVLDQAGRRVLLRRLVREGLLEAGG